MSHRILALFRVDGRARTKGSLKVYCMKNRAHSVKVEEEVAESKRWRRAVALAAQAQSREVWGTPTLGHAGPVEVRLAVYLPRQLSVAKGQEGTVVPSHSTDFPTDIKLGDVDKLARNIGDALTDSRLILDDSQITDFLVAKRWAPLGMTGAAGWAEVMVMEADPAAALGGPYWMPGMADPIAPERRLLERAV